MRIRSLIRKFAFSPLLPPPPFQRGVKSEFPQRQRWGILRGAQRMSTEPIQPKNCFPEFFSKVYGYLTFSNQTIGEDFASALKFWGRFCSLWEYLCVYNFLAKQGVETALKLIISISNKYAATSEYFIFVGIDQCEIITLFNISNKTLNSE